MIRFTLRLPDELHAAIKAIAEKENRSLHAQIIHVLQEFVRRYQEAKEQG